MAKKNQNKKTSAKQSRQRALNAFDTAADDEYYIKGLRQQQDIDLEHISDERIRDLLNNEVDPDDDEEIDSDEAMGSGSDISLGEPDSGDEDEWGDSLDEEELLPLSEVWDRNDEVENEDKPADKKKDKSFSSKASAPSPVSIPAPSASEESESGSDADDESVSESESEDDDEDESGEESVGLSDDNIESDEESDEEENNALRQAIKNIGNKNNTTFDNAKLAEAAEENPFALPGQDAGLSVEDIIPDVQSGKTLAVPAPKRIQERAERGAAYKLAKDEVNKWTDTVQANRQAEHLQFPINAPPKMEAASPFAMPEQSSKSKSDTASLEDKVNQILHSSALADENAASTFEETAPSKLSIEDLKQRRKELRYMRDLMFREEQRAKRIKKIKSKSYRKVHKKERQKMAELEGEEEGSDDGHSDTEKAERDRALERATLRHKSTNSKWAKRLLDQGLTRDASTRAELEEMLRQSDSLRQKIRGNEQDEEDDSDYNEESLAFGLDNDDDEDAAEEQDEGKKQKKGVLGMKFMQDAEKRRREENRKMLNDDYDSDNEDSNVGRRSFNPAGQQLKRDMETMAEESDESDGEGGIRSISKKTKTVNTGESGRQSNNKRQGAPAQGEETVEFIPQVPEPREPKRKPVSKEISSHASSNDAPENPWLAASAKSSVPGTVKLSAPSKNVSNDITVGSGTGAGADAKDGNNKRRSKNGSIVVENTFGDGLVREKDLTLQQQDLVKQAFAGDDVVADFEATKQAEIDEDGDKEVDETLPGWGTWSNEKPRVKKVRHIAGVDEKKRRDYKKSNVVINEKVNKKASKYNASAVPFPFENRQQYERSLRMPIGQEWVSKDTFQRQTKPRVLVKRGAIIDPIKKPKSNR